MANAASRAADPAPVADEAAIDPLLKREWSYCLFCSGPLDTGFECKYCGADLLPIVKALRAAPRPVVADEAAIAAWENVAQRLSVDSGESWDSSPHQGNVDSDLERFVLLASDIDEAVRLMRAAPRNDDKLRRILADWTHRYGSDLVPPSGWSDTYGEGMRNAKEWVRKILAESPAGDAVSKSATGLVESLTARLQAAESECSTLRKLNATHVASVENLQAAYENAKRQLAEAEAERDAAQKERDEERRKAAEHELNWRSVSDKLVDSWAERDNLQADLAAAKAESARAVVEELLDVQDYFGTQAVNARNAAKRPTPEDKRVGNGYDVQARIWDAAIGNIEHRIHKLRAAQPPQPQPATVRQGDEVLRDFMEVNTNPDNNRLFAAVVELCRRALEGQ